MKRPIRFLAILLLAVSNITQMATAEPTCEDCTHDKAYSAAKIYGTKPTRGIILHLHGCAGLRAGQGWQREWVDYFTFHGFLVIAIDSFADVRPPPAACPGNPWVYEKNLIYTLRTRQAQYAVTMIRTKYPAQEIFVWGHGEGGVTAQTMTADIDGVISTGTPCPDEWLEGIAQTPLIIIQGTNDEYLREAKNNPLYDSLDDRCKMLMNQPNWEWLTVEGMGHPAELSRMDVKARISQFLGIPYSQ